MYVGAVVVDPVLQKVVGIANDQRHVHPLQHCVMVCIDNVAHGQGGGAWLSCGKMRLYSEIKFTVVKSNI